MNFLLRNRVSRSAIERFIRGAFARDPTLEELVLPLPVVRGAPFSLDVEDRVGLALDAIPSETSRAERRLLYRFFASVWSGRGDVLEIGPYLGGTTRAIALGMLASPKRDPSARLITVDRFELDSFYTIERIRAMLAPVIQAGLVSESDLAEVHAQQSFLPAFQRLHRATDYERLLDVRSQALPGSPDERLRAPFEAPRGPVEAVFVDGCKTWYSMKHLLVSMASSVPAGAWFLFQDYLDFRCYWISFMLERMGDVFVQLLRADSTYAFSLRRPLDPVEIHKRIPDDPRQLGAGEADAVFDTLAERAFHREDRRARITHILQKASARRARGETTGARALLDELDRARWASGYGDLLAQARRKLA